MRIVIDYINSRKIEKMVGVEKIHQQKSYYSASIDAESKNLCIDVCEGFMLDALKVAAGILPLLDSLWYSVEGIKSALKELSKRSGKWDK